MPAAWTPATLASTLPRADRHELGPQRVYFYDVETRAEISDHPLAGMIWTGEEFGSLLGRTCDPGAPPAICIRGLVLPESERKW